MSPLKGGEREPSMKEGQAVFIARLARETAQERRG